MTTAAAVCGVLAAPQWASAQTAKGPLRIIVPYTAGGSIDVSVRRIAERLEPVLGTILVENRPGAGGGIGMNAIARAPADGLTVGIAAVATNAINPWLFKNLPYDAEKDFAPITQMTRIPNLLVMNAEVAKREGIETFDDFMAYAKRNSGKLSYGSGGNGSAGHLAGEIFKRETGLDIVHVPYNGGAPSQLALLSQQVDFTFDNLSSAAANIRAGKLKPLAVTTLERSQLLPELPPVADVIPGFAIDTWWGLVAPAGTPADVVETLNKHFVQALHSPEVMKTYGDMMMDTVTSTPQEFGEFMAKERARYEQIVKISGASVD
ncbi:MAG: tripartite tricarboxylate transporter substrate binding protein [Comamonadaceae bacterium]|nr:tripartite tricarboxylate transporter substrate binding protein [Comamonas kerstersii]MDO4967922.1 tripartite tricarboxylate transporter substrate binding protein [Comamonadaceae bacterium]